MGRGPVRRHMTQEYGVLARGMVNTSVGSDGAAAPGAWAADAGADEGSRIMAPRTSPTPGPPRART